MDSSIVTLQLRVKDLETKADVQDFLIEGLTRKVARLEMLTNVPSRQQLSP